MIYREPRPRRRAELEVDLADPSPDVVSVAIIDAASHADPDWVVEAVLSLAHDERSGVRHAALLGLGILARRGMLRADRRVWQTALEARSDRAVGGTADDLLDDLELYGTPGRILDED